MRSWAYPCPTRPHAGLHHFHHEQGVALAALEQERVQCRVERPTGYAARQGGGDAHAQRPQLDLAQQAVAAQGGQERRQLQRLVFARAQGGYDQQRRMRRKTAAFQWQPDKIIAHTYAFVYVLVREQQFSISSN